MASRLGVPVEVVGRPSTWDGRMPGKDGVCAGVGLVEGDEDDDSGWDRDADADGDGVEVDVLLAFASLLVTPVPESVPGSRMAFRFPSRAGAPAAMEDCAGDSRGPVDDAAERVELMDPEDAGIPIFFRRKDMATDYNKYFSFSHAGSVVSACYVN